MYETIGFPFGTEQKRISDNYYIYIKFQYVIILEKC
jgi:hypothetical protein